jgi:hypothetical protein
VPPTIDGQQPDILTTWSGKKSNDLPRPSEDSVVGNYYHFHHDMENTAKSTYKSPRSSSKIWSREDLKHHFAGAPEFDMRSLRPRIDYRWLSKQESSDCPRDFLDATHTTFEAATLEHLHGRRQSREMDKHDTTAEHIPMMEVPNMTSLNGSEPGTVGLEYFLQTPLSDSKRCAEDDEEAFVYKRNMLINSPEKLGLRPLNLGYIIDRLSELGNERQCKTPRIDRTGERTKSAVDKLYATLFSELLTEPDLLEDETPLTGLDDQIVALARVLITSRLWYDFSLVENRIRLGQILWPSFNDDDDDESILDLDQDAKTDMLNQRNLLLLQITLSCELLVRVELSTFPTSGFSRKLRWDLVLASRFLNNMRIAPRTLAGRDTNRYRDSFTSIASFVTASETLVEERVEPILYPRHERRQVEGLLSFADALAWPHAEEIRERFSERVKRRDASLFDVYAASTPSQPPNQANNYFSLQKRPQFSRMGTAQSLQLLPASAYGIDSSFHLGGWLSRSWLTGFVLPGESTSHLLISTLLENSPAAVTALGDAANLYQGFIYKSRSYWSKSCVVGRVIAAANGASDCMGWISCNSEKQQDGWVDVEVKDLAARFSSPPRSSNNNDTSLSTDSAFVRGHSNTLTDAEFSWPVDGLVVLGNEAHYHGFNLLPTGVDIDLLHDDPIYSTPTTPPTSIASLDFSSKKHPNVRTTLPLLYDVQFISAAPCFPNQPVAATCASSTPSSRSSHLSSSLKELPLPPAHPLHCSYAMQIIPAASILADDFTDTVHLGDETVILDCRGTGELQLLARAWCAKVGENAVVGRLGRTCLACCVREAQGLGVKIVIRV